MHYVTTGTTYNYGYHVAFLGEIIDLPLNSQDVVVQPNLLKVMSLVAALTYLLILLLMRFT